jgi:hypothetical protein
MVLKLRNIIRALIRTRNYNPDDYSDQGDRTGRTYKPVTKLFLRATRAGLLRFKNHQRDYGNATENQRPHRQQSHSRKSPITDPDEPPQIDSLALVRLTTFLQNDCGIRIEDEELAAENFATGTETQPGS